MKQESAPTDASVAEQKTDGQSSDEQPSVEWSPAEWQAELLELRKQIDRLDHGLVLMLANRFALTRRVGNIKARVGLQSFDPKREAEKLADIRQLCERHGVNGDLVAEMLAQIMRETVKNHDRIRSGLESGR